MNGKFRAGRCFPVSLYRNCLRLTLESNITAYLESNEHDDIGLTFLGFVGLNTWINKGNKFIKHYLIDYSS